ncbi:MAG: hypothetical protein ABF545_00095 [Bifidobacterium psychraerophilum]|uniref:hypothetical protein n=1 Tax=Bifidobacterium psychraerophilum TaxID=218140 RepID=UPI0039EA654F
MNDSTTHDSNPALSSLAREYAPRLQSVRARIGADPEYQFSFGHIERSDVYSLGIIRDEDGQVVFDKDITRGSLDTVLIAAQTLVNLAEANRQALSDLAERRRDAMAAVDPTTGPDAWQSRFEHIPHPDLVSEHTPGWCDEDAGDPVVASRFIFRSHNDEFGLDFDVIENNPGTVSVGLLPTKWDWNVQTAEELLTLSDHTGRLQQWLDDCATVTAWIRQHDESEHTHE